MKISGDAYIPIMAHGDYQLEPIHEQDLRDIGPRAFKTAAPKPKLLSEREALPTVASVAGLQARMQQAGAAASRQTKGLFADVVHDARSLVEEAKSVQAKPALFTDSDSDTEEHAQRETQREGGEEVLAAFENPLDVEEQRLSD